MMTFCRLSLCAAALSFGSCSHPLAPEPAEFKLTAESLSKQYPTWRETEAGRLYGGKILISRDDEGGKTYEASGGALLVTKTEPPIRALAPSISVTADCAEAYGKSTIKKGDRLYLGEDESAKISIQGTEIRPEGAHVVRGIAEAESEPPAGTGSPETVDLTLALTPTFGAAPAPTPPLLPPPPTPPSEPVKVKPARAAPPKVVSSPPAKPRTVAAKPIDEAAKTGGLPVKPIPPIPPMPKVRETPAIDRSKLLNLMREPTDR